MSDAEMDNLRVRLGRKVRYHLGPYCPDREDVVQEAMTRLVRANRANKIQHPENPGAFLNGVCNNVIAEYRRRLSREGADIGDLPERPNGGKSCAETLELRDAVERALSQLLHRDRRILTGIYLEGKSSAEICTEHGISEDQLRVVLFRAKARFRKIYLQAMKPATPMVHSATVT
jgi:RNA polymerase sigma factor (sigma-70 family)